jgi:hypothetical protein
MEGPEEITNSLSQLLSTVGSHNIKKYTLAVQHIHRPQTENPWSIVCYLMLQDVKKVSVQQKSS